MKTMDGERLRLLLDMLGLSPRDAPVFLDVNERTLRRWLKDPDAEIPLTVAMLLELIYETGWTTREVSDLVRKE